ncbi:MAG: hypothetical protein RLO52_40950 [Sandaracinaceae bacterium]|nr:MAG: hypothetical protein EVA89_16880 [Sandaracinaceae bacterium]
MRRALWMGWILASGCASFDTGSVARSSAAELLACNEAALEMSQVGAYRYRAAGCGGEVTVACTASALEPRCLRVSDAAPVAADVEDHAPGEVEPSQTVAPEREQEQAQEARIRAGLDARKDDVLACVGAERAAVRVAYAADGTLTFGLQGALAGSPEERCVVDALDGVRAPASGRAGVVVHLLR